MTANAARWADAPRNKRMMHINELKSALQIAITKVTIMDPAAASGGLVRQWQALLKELPEAGDPR